MAVFIAFSFSALHLGQAIATTVSGNYRDASTFRSVTEDKTGPGTVSANATASKATGDLSVLADATSDGLSSSAAGTPADQSAGYVVKYDNHHASAGIGGTSGYVWGEIRHLISDVAPGTRTVKVDFTQLSAAYSSCAPSTGLLGYQGKVSNCSAVVQVHSVVTYFPPCATAGGCGPRTWRLTPNVPSGASGAAITTETPSFNFEAGGLVEVRAGLVGSAFATGKGGFARVSGSGRVAAITVS